MQEPDPAVVATLRRLHLVDGSAVPAMIPLAGGVSSDIWRVDLPDGPVCIKRALPRLKVAAVWEAPVERNQYEWAWLQLAATVTPESVPALVGHDPEAGCFVMRFLEPETHPSWKDLLRQGIVDLGIARTVGQRLAAVHNATADRADLRDQFATDHIFHAIRIEPYLLATARRHPDVAPILEELAADTAQTHEALVHGDVSPKNILIGPHGPVFLDAECAWYGDPVFDLAFCLNHLLLKCLWTPDATSRFLEAFEVLADAYLDKSSWQPRATVETRTARLLPGLFLARVDGKSPVEYVTDERDRDLVRQVSRPLLLEPPSSLNVIRHTWRAALEIRR